MVNFVVAVVLLFVDYGAENWYDINKHTYSYLPEPLTCNGPTLRDQFKTLTGISFKNLSSSLSDTAAVAPKPRN